MRQKAHAIDKPASTYRERIVLFHTDLLIRRNRVSPQAKGAGFHILSHLCSVLCT